VLEIVRDFIKREKPDKVAFSAWKEEDDHSSRIKLYDRMITRFASQMGYRLANARETDYEKHYQLVRVK